MRFCLSPGKHPASSGSRAHTFASSCVMPCAMRLRTRCFPPKGAIIETPAQEPTASSVGCSGTSTCGSSGTSADAAFAACPFMMACSSLRCTGAEVCPTRKEGEVRVCACVCACVRVCAVVRFLVGQLYRSTPLRNNFISPAGLTGGRSTLEFFFYFSFSISTFHLRYSHSFSSRDGVQYSPSPSLAKGEVELLCTQD